MGLTVQEIRRFVALVHSEGRRRDLNEALAAVDNGLIREADELHRSGAVGP